MKVPQKHFNSRRAHGQGISEYAAVIAFVSVLVSIAFGLSNGQLLPSVKSAFSIVQVQLNNVSTEAGDAV
jgi:hypothetical protein